MGARLNGVRSFTTNEALRRARTEEPIAPENWRHPPGFICGGGFVMAQGDVWSGLWYCLVTVPGGEYRCLDGLASTGVTGYVPTETYWTRRHRGRERLRVQIQRPVWRSYVFARISEICDWSPIQARDAFGRSRLGVIGVIAAGGAPTPIAAPILRGIAEDEAKGWFNEDARAALVEEGNRPPIEAGDSVRIVGGPLAGCEGTAENDNEKEAARVFVNLFGRETLMTISLRDLENLTRPLPLPVNLRRSLT